VQGPFVHRLRGIVAECTDKALDLLHLMRFAVCAKRYGEGSRDWYLAELVVRRSERDGRKGPKTD
jgi:hypothetical protein